MFVCMSRVPYAYEDQRKASDLLGLYGVQRFLCSQISARKTRNVKHAGRAVSLKEDMYNLFSTQKAESMCG